MKILVASNSEIKLAAVREAFAGVRVQVDGRGSRSLVNEQPVGNDETTMGAMNRLTQIAVVSGYDFYVAIENGLEEIGGWWSDFGFVVMQNRAGIRKFAKSAGVIFPDTYVEEAFRRGFETTTAGMIIAEKLGGSDTDPHYTLTAGFVTRKQLLVQAVKICYGQLSRITR